VITLRAAGDAGPGLAARREWGPSLFRAVPERLARASLLSPSDGRRSSDSTLTTASGSAADSLRPGVVWVQDRRHLVLRVGQAPEIRCQPPRALATGAARDTPHVRQFGLSTSRTCVERAGTLVRLARRHPCAGIQPARLGRWDPPHARRRHRLAPLVARPTRQPDGRRGLRRPNG